MSVLMERYTLVYLTLRDDKVIVSVAGSGWETFSI